MRPVFSNYWFNVTIGDACGGPEVQKSTNMTDIKCICDKYESMGGVDYNDTRTRWYRLIDSCPADVKWNFTLYVTNNVRNWPRFCSYANQEKGRFPPPSSLNLGDRLGTCANY